MIPFPNKKYDIIYADPAWKYAKRNKNTSFGGGSYAQYPMMDLKDICKLPVKNICNDNSFLFLWVTMPYLMRANQVIEAWGFKYITTAFTWVKTNKNSGTIFKGIGNYTKHNAELCLLAKKGKGVKRIAKDVCQIIMEQRREHSRKPDRTRTDITRLFGDIPRIELFARQRVDGWDNWGNQV